MLLPIGKDYPPYIIAEMSGNHNQSFETAIKIADAAKNANASALKLQTYNAETLTIDCKGPDFLISDRNSLWSGNSLFDLYKKAYTDWDWIKSIYDHCNKIGLPCFSSVFDIKSVDFWEELDPPAYKIASFENVHIPLIKYTAQTKRPLIISTGLASEEEIDEMVDAARSNGCSQLILLKCTSDYPADHRDVNLLSIPYLEKKYNVDAGLSDHTLGNDVALASIALGAKVIEKHFIYSRDEGGVDSAFSADVNEFSELVEKARFINETLGKVDFSRSKSEEKSMQFRRSIYAIDDVSIGEKFTEENIAIIRPGFGLHPRYYEKLIGNIAKKNYQFGDRLDPIELKK